MVSDKNAVPGSGRKGSVLPEMVSVKSYRSGEGVGKMGSYPDTEEATKAEQMGAVSKVKSNSMKPSYRN